MFHGGNTWSGREIHIYSVSEGGGTTDQTNKNYVFFIQYPSVGLGFKAIDHFMFVSGFRCTVD